MEPQGTVPSTPVADDPAITTPVPDDDDDELVTEEINHDYWEVCEDQLIRHHVQPRLQLFFPFDTWSCPINLEEIAPNRMTVGQ